MCFYSDAAEVRLDDELVRLEFCVDGDAIAQVTLRTRAMDSLIADYMRLLSERDGRPANILAYQRAG